MGARDPIERALEQLWYRRRGLGFTLAAPILAPAVLGTWLAGRWRRQVRREAPALPTVAVGNLAVGGTGKTQVVMHLAAAARALAIVSRGYGGRLATPTVIEPTTDPVDCGDEPLLLARRLPEATVIVAHDRALGIALAKERGCKHAILDDGLQQTAVEPTARVAVFGAESPLGNRALLPLGPLRESVATLRHEDLIWLHGLGDGRELPRIDVRSRSRPIGLVAVGAVTPNPLPLAGQRIFAFAGIARPERFFQTLEQGGATLLGTARYADHRRFRSEEIEALAARAKAAGADALVCTEKDGVRLPRSKAQVFALRTELEILEGEPHIQRLLAGLR